MSLSPAEHRSRVALDTRVLLAMRGEHLDVHPARSPAAALTGEILPEGSVRAGEAGAFLCVYRFPLMARNGSRIESTHVLFDVSSPAYPFHKPLVQVVRRPFPWWAHVSTTTGVFCAGEGWDEAGGGMLLAQLVRHIAMLLNWDQRDLATLDALDPSALAYWRAHGARPQNPGLRYPELPEDIAFDPPATRPLFRKAPTAQSAPARFRRMP